MAAIIEIEIGSVSDDELLRRYVAGEDRAALQELVRRYAAMVYSAARRQVFRADLADDVAQNVFIVLARRAGCIRSQAALATWLLTTTRHIAANTMRSEISRHKREEAAGLSQLQRQADQAGEQEQWHAIAPLLDQAIARLGRADQTAVALRYFRGLSLREVGVALGINEDAARKRVSRAVERLRLKLGAAALTSTETTLSALLAGRAVESAPSHIMVHAASAAASAGKAGGSFFSGVLTMTATTKFGVGIVAIAVLLGGGYGVIRLSQSSFLDELKLADSTAANIPVEPMAPGGPDWKADFKHTYALADGQNVKHVLEPFIPARMTFFQSTRARQKDASSSDHLYLWQESDGTFQFLGGFAWSSRPGGPVRPTATILSVACALTGLPQFRFQGMPVFLNEPVDGDWVGRRGASTVDLLKGISDAIHARTHQSLVFTKRSVDHELIVVSGNSQSTGTAQISRTRQTNADGSVTEHIQGSGTVSSLLMQLNGNDGVWCDDLTDPGTTVDYQYDDPTGPLDDAGLDALLQKLSDQTHLTFKREQGKTDVWNLAPAQ